MLRYSVRAFRRILQPRVLYSSMPDTNKTQTPLLLKLMDEFDDVRFVTKALGNKELNSVNFEEWKDRIYELRKYHFTDADCFMMISRYPYLLQIPLESFETSVKQWYLSDLEHENFQYLLLNQPQLLEVDVKIIRKRLPQLRLYFKSSKLLCTLLIVSPNVMFDDWETLMEKLNYVKVKGYNMLEVTESQVLSKPLMFIQFRFDLLEKCGIYKQDDTPIHKKNKYDKTKHKNPFLKDVVNSSAKAFIKVAKISLEEYLVYKSFFYEQEDDDEEVDAKDNYK